jgi:hypothetical protein
MRLFRSIVAVLAVVGMLGLACSSAPSGPGTPELIGDGRRVLFIGNSLTYWNDLPLIVQALADSAGGEPLAVMTVAFPDYNLDDHRARGAAERAIALGQWDVVVLQQGPSSVEENRVQLRESVGVLSEQIRAVGATPALYSVWPSEGRRADFPRAIESYTLAARDVGGLLFPVASAWLAAWERDATITLYSADGLHPSVAGSYLAALVMYGVLYGRTPVGLPARVRLASGVELGVTPGRAAVLQEAAAIAIGPLREAR